MKKLIFAFNVLLLLTFTCQANNAQEQEPEWIRVLQLNTYASQIGQVVTSDGDYVYMAGTISGPVTFEGNSFESNGLTDMVLAKVSTAGVTSWIRQIYAEEWALITPVAIKTDASGNILVSGTFYGSVTVGTSTVYSTDVVNAFIAQFDGYGNGNWITAFESYGTGSSEIAVDGSGNSYVLSRSRKLIKFNSSGVLQWEQSYPDKTLQALAIYGSGLFIGGALQPGTTTFGTIDLESSNHVNTGFLIKSDLDGNYSTAVVNNAPAKSTLEGAYTASGTFNHPTEGLRQINLTKYLSGFDEDSLTTAIGDLAYPQGNIILTINPDYSVTIGGELVTESAPVVATTGLDNYYDPGEQKFYLNYEYTLSTGTRYISEILTRDYYAIGFGSAITDIAVKADGNLIVAGSYAFNLNLGGIIIEKAFISFYNFIGKCDNNFAFDWVNSSNSLTPGNDIYNFRYRVFTDDAGEIFEYGQIPNSFIFGSVEIQPNNGQFLLKFDSDGEPLDFYALQYIALNRLSVSPSGKIIVTGTYSYEGSPSYGNLFLRQYNNYMTEEWNKISTYALSGTARLTYTKHDSSANTYIQARILGNCDFFGSDIQVNNSVTVNAKLNLDGEVVWLNMINDLLPAQSTGAYFGPRFVVDKEQNLLTVGIFGESVTIGSETLSNDNAISDGYIVKYTPDGETDWVVQLKTDSIYEIYGITTDEENNVIIAGEFRSELTVLNHTISGNDIDAAFLIKLDPEGNYIWAKGFPIGGTVYHAIPAADGNNNIYMALDVTVPENQTLTFGNVSTHQAEAEATVLVKFDHNGNTQWVKTYGAVDNDPTSSSWPVDIKADAEGNSYLWGWCKTNAVFGTTTLVNPLSNSMFYYITKINTSGEVVWVKPIYERNYSYNYGDLLDIDQVGNVYVGGHFRDAMSIETHTFVPAGTNDFFVAKFSENGDYQWIKTIPGNSSAMINALDVYQNNILSIAGYASGGSLLGEFEIKYRGGSTCITALLIGDVKYLAVDPTELSIEAQTNSTDTFYIYSNTSWMAESDQAWLTLSATSGINDADIIITASENTSEYDRYAVITISGNGVATKYISVTQAGIETKVTETTRFPYVDIYPNPNNGKFNLILENIMWDDIRITVANTAGIIIRDFNLNLQSEMNNQEIDLGNIAKGFYFIHLQSDKVNIIKTFIVN